MTEPILLLCFLFGFLFRLNFDTHTNNFILFEFLSSLYESVILYV